MAKQIKLKIITPEKLIIDEMVDQVSLPTDLGQITILPDHIPLITDLASGDIVAISGGEQIPFAVIGGFVEIKWESLKTGEKPVTSVAILADFAEHVSDISDEKIAKAKAKAEEIKKKMEERHEEEVDFEHFATELERSLTQVRVADKWRTRKYRK